MENPNRCHIQPNGFRPELQRRGVRWELRPWPAAHKGRGQVLKT